MSHRLHYKGDVRIALATTGPLDPSTDVPGAHRVESASYDPETDRTTAYLEEVEG